MKYRVSGADRESGSNIELVLDAADENEASKIANRKQVIVSRVECLVDPVPTGASAGYVYVLINASMPGLIKVGITRDSPATRAAQLSVGTSVPSPFIVAYSAYFHNCEEAEQYVHRALEDQGRRVTKNREFFKAPLEDVINAISAYKGSPSLDVSAEEKDEKLSLEPVAALLEEAAKLKENDAIANAPRIRNCLVEAIRLGSGEACSSLASMYCADGPFADGSKATSLLRQGAALGHAGCYSTLAGWALIGAGDTLQDADEAVRLYEQAARLGSWEACRELSQIFSDDTHGKKDLNRALGWAKKGVERGGDECYLSMANIYRDANNWLNAEKCFAQYFQSAKFKNGSDAGAVRTYINLANFFNVVPRRIDLILATSISVRAKIIVDIDDWIEFPVWDEHPRTMELYRRVRSIVLESMGEQGPSEVDREKKRIRQVEEELGYASYGGRNKFFKDLFNGEFDS